MLAVVLMQPPAGVDPYVLFTFRVTSSISPCPAPALLGHRVIRGAHHTRKRLPQRHGSLHWRWIFSKTPIWANDEVIE
jgi:hypothetical protein